MEAINSSMGKLSAPTNPASICEGEVERNIIWNFTQHLATPEQREQGVRDLPEEFRQKLVEFLTFEDIPDDEDIQIHVGELLCLLCYIDAKYGDRIMIGGAPFLMERLSAALRHSQYRPVFAFSRRESVEQVMPDGTVRKTAVFRHLGFVEPEAPQQY
jgi:hypothetical protein